MPSQYGLKSMLSAIDHDEVKAVKMNLQTNPHLVELFFTYACEVEAFDTIYYLLTTQTIPLGQIKNQQKAALERQAYNVYKLLHYAQSQ